VWRWLLRRWRPGSSEIAASQPVSFWQWWFSPAMKQGSKHDHAPERTWESGKAAKPAIIQMQGHSTGPQFWQFWTKFAP